MQMKKGYIGIVPNWDRAVNEPFLGAEMLLETAFLREQ